MKYAIILSISLSAVSCSQQEKPAATSVATEESSTTVTLSPAQLRAAGISTVTPEKRNLSAILKASGRVEAPPQNVVSVSAPMGGYVKSTRMLPGMKVGKGEVIAVMEDQQYVTLQQDYLTSLAQLKYSESEYKRQKSLNESKSASDKILQQAESEYTSKKVQVAGLSERLKLIGIDPQRLNENTLSRAVNIYSPVDGFITKMNVNVGKHVTPSEILFELIDPDDIHLTLTVFERDIAKIHLGQKVIAYTNNSDQKYEAEVIQVGHSLGADRSIDVHCHFLKYDRQLVPGMYVNAELPVVSSNAWSVPDQSIVSFEGRNFVFTELRPGTYKMVHVETGESEGGFTELKNADSLAGSKIAAKGAYQLLMSLKNKGE
jgi:cobalt-zinc-cadmium efflux system membrane fusion protein